MPYSHWPIFAWANGLQTNRIHTEQELGVDLGVTKRHNYCAPYSALQQNTALTRFIPAPFLALFFFPTVQRGSTRRANSVCEGAAYV